MTKYLDQEGLCSIAQNYSLFYIDLFINRFGSDPFVNPNLTAIGLRTFGLETIIEFPLTFALAVINFLFRPEILKFVKLPRLEINPLPILSNSNLILPASTFMDLYRGPEYTKSLFP